MKSSQFNRRPNIEEFEPRQPYIKKKRINWGIIIYSAVILLLLFFVGRYLVEQFFYVEAKGQVLYKKIDVQLPSDAQLIEIYKEEGEDIGRGDTLFRYAWSDALNPSSTGSGFGFIDKSGISKDWLQKEMLRIQKDIEKLKVQNQGHRELLSHYQGRLETVKEGIYMDVYTSKQLDQIKDQISRLRTKIQSNYSEINKLKAYNERLKTNSEDQQQRMQKLMNNGFRLDPDTLRKYSNFYAAPITGNLTQIFKQEFEVASKSEKIMTIHKKGKVIVRAFFDQKDLKYVGEGDEVTIRFPDGTKSQGRVQQLYFSTHELPEAFQKPGQPLDRAIAADIQPLEGENVNEWRSFYKMTVTIRKRMLKL